MKYANTKFLFTASIEFIPVSYVSKPPQTYATSVIVKVSLIHDISS